MVTTEYSFHHSGCRIVTESGVSDLEFLLRDSESAAEQTEV